MLCERIVWEDVWCESRKCYVRELSVFTDKNMSCKRVFSAVIGQRVVREQSICLFQQLVFCSFKPGQVFRALSRLPQGEAFHLYRLWGPPPQTFMQLNVHNYL